MTRRTPESLRSHRWFGVEDLRAFGHRSRTLQMGYGPEDFMGKPVIRGLYDWLGITNQYTMRGKNAGIFRETEKWTPEERAKMEDQTNRIYYDDFIPKVAAGRKRPLPRFPRRIGVLTGRDAAAKGDVVATISQRFPPARLVPVPAVDSADAGPLPA